MMGCYGVEIRKGKNWKYTKREEKIREGSNITIAVLVEENRMSEIYSSRVESSRDRREWNGRWMSGVKIFQEFIIVNADEVHT